MADSILLEDGSFLLQEDDIGTFVLESGRGLEIDVRGGTLGVVKGVPSVIGLEFTALGGQVTASVETGNDLTLLLSGLSITSSYQPITAPSQNDLVVPLSSTQIFAFDDVLPPMPTVPGDALNLLTDFGVSPSNTVDQQTVLANILSGALVNGKRLGVDGNFLVFPPGVYRHSDALPVTVAGATLWSDEPNPAILHALATTTANHTSLSLEANNVEVYGFEFWSQMTGRSGGYRDCAVGIIGTLGGPWRDGCIVRRNRITENPSNQCAAPGGVRAQTASNYLIAENDVSRTWQDSFFNTHGSFNGRIVWNTVRENGDDMVSVVSYTESGGPNLTDAQISADLANIEAARLCHDIYIAQNDVSGNYWGRGITVVGGRNILIERNTISKTCHGAGILIAREDIEFGVDDVIARNNTITDCQTTLPAFMPSGFVFNTTGQGAIELNATTTASEDSFPNLVEAYEVKNVELSNNTITRTINYAVKVNPRSNPTSRIGNVGILNNTFLTITSSPAIQVISPMPPSGMNIYATGNTDDGAASTYAGSTPPAPTVTGSITLGEIVGQEVSLVSSFTTFPTRSIGNSISSPTIAVGRGTLSVLSSGDKVVGLTNGFQFTASAGQLDVLHMLLSSPITTAAGTLTPLSQFPALVGQEMTAQAGFVGAAQEFDDNLISSGIGDLGSVESASELLGLESVTAFGSLAVTGDTVQPIGDGLEITTASDDVLYELVFTLVGQEITTIQGQMLAPIELLGIEIPVVAGQLFTTNDREQVLTGIQFSVEVGPLGTRPSVDLIGQEFTSDFFPWLGPRVVALEGLEFEAEAGELEPPEHRRREAGIAVSVGKARILFEVDGKQYSARSTEEARSILEQILEAAQQKAKEELAKALESKQRLSRIKSVVAHKLQPPSIRLDASEDVLGAIQREVEDIEGKIKEIYDDALRNAEIGILLRRQKEIQEEEDFMTGLFL